MGITVEIDGVGRVELDDSFGTLSPEKQSAIIQGIVRSVSKPDPMQGMRDRIAAAKAGTLTVSPDSAARAASADQIAQDRMTIASGGPVLAGVTKFAQGVPFVGEYSDELTGLLDRATGGTGSAGDAQKAMQDAMAREYPKTSTALNVAGGVSGSLGAVGLLGKGAQALGLASKIPTSLAGKIVSGGLLGIGGGGAEGFVSGYGAGEGDGRMASAQDRGLIGAAVGGLAGLAAPAVATGIRKALEAFKGSDVRTIAQTFKVSPEAAKSIRAFIANDDFDAAEAAIRQAGPDGMLADAGGGFTQALDTSMQSGGAAARIGREAVDSRAIAADAKLTDVLDSTLGDPQGIKGTARDIAERTSAARKAAYDVAFGTPINYADDTGRAVEEVLGRIPPAPLSAAIKDANEEMIARGMKNMQIMAEVAPDGSVVFREMPNVRQLNEIKKSLDKIANDNVDDFGRKNGTGLRYESLARQLRDAVKDAVPAYGSALKLGGDKIAEDNALALGRDLFKSSTTREIVQETLDGAGDEAIRAAQRGLRSQLDETLANVKGTITNPDMDINQVLKLWKETSSEANRQKVAMVLGQSEADRLFAALDEAGAQLGTSANVARNTATAARVSGQRTVSTIAKGGIRQLLKNGEGLQAAKRVVQVLTDSTPEAMLAREQGIYAEIADILTSKRGQEAQDALRIIQRAIEGQPVSSADAARVARQVTSGLALGGYQTATRSLSTPPRVQGTR